MLSFREAQKLYNQILVNGGFTYNVLTKQYAQSGYSVGVNKYFEFTKDVNTFYAHDIYLYCLKNTVQLSLSNVFLGAWVHDDIVYLDISIIFPDNVHHGRDDALTHARANDQIAIYDLANQTDILVA